MTNLYTTYNGGTLQTLNSSTSMGGWENDIHKMWVLDVDPHHKGNNLALDNDSNVNAYGVSIKAASGVKISHIFSIQNAAKAQGSWNNWQHGGSRQPVIEVKPGAEGYGSKWVPKGVTVQYIFNILSPSGSGPIQVHSCEAYNGAGCNFNHIFSHGGVAMRFESIGEQPDESTCMPTNGGPWYYTKSGSTTAGSSGTFDKIIFKNYLKIKNASASYIEGWNGNAALFLASHCYVHGAVTVSKVTSRNNYRAIVVSSANATRVLDYSTPDYYGSGFFNKNTSSVSNVDIKAYTGNIAQEPMPNSGTQQYADIAPTSNIFLTRVDIHMALNANSNCRPASPFTNVTYSGAFMQTSEYTNNPNYNPWTASSHTCVSGNYGFGSW